MPTQTGIIRLARQFQLEAKHVKVIKFGVYQLRTASGKNYCLKRMRYSLPYVRWMDRSLRQVRQQGFPKIAWRRLGEPTGRRLYAFTNNDNRPYILTGWYKARHPSPDSTSDMRACMKALAKFHLAGKRVKTSKIGALDMLGKWPQLLQKQHYLLIRQISKAKRNGYRPPLNQLLKLHGDSILKRAEEAIKILRKSNYYAACRSARTRGALCHGDSGPTNFLLTPGKGVYLIDFETLRYDLHIYDLYRMVRLAGERNNWNFSKARAALNGYRSVKELKPSDYMLLKVRLLFPDRIRDLLEKYDHRGTVEKRRIEQSLRDAIYNERHLIRFVKELDDYARGAKSV